MITKDHTADKSERIEAIVTQLGMAFAELRCIGSERLLRQGVSMTQIHVMAMLARHGDLPMGRLADLLDVSLSNATGLVDRMEERGLVERVRVPDDRRVVLVKVSDAGRDALRAFEMLKEDVARKVLHELGGPAIERLQAAIDDLRNGVASLAAREPDLFVHSHAHDRIVGDAASRGGAAQTDATRPAKGVTS